MVKEGRGQELMSRESWGVPITAQRYMSLAGVRCVAQECDTRFHAACGYRGSL